jgi:hypothetical protein
MPSGENSADTPEVPYRTPRLWLRRSLRCTPKRGSVSNTDCRTSGGFHTQFAGSPLFAEATVSCRPTRAGATTTMPLLQRSSCPLLALLNPSEEMNRFPDCATWRRRTSQPSIQYTLYYNSYSWVGNINKSRVQIGFVGFFIAIFLVISQERSNILP